MKKVVLMLSILLISQVSLAQVAPEFEVTGVGYYCHQEPEAAYLNALSELQSKAEKVCKGSPAIMVTDIEDKRNHCRLTLRAGYICEEQGSACE